MTVLPTIDDALVEFIRAHADTAIEDLLLRVTPPSGIDKAFVATQVQARRERVDKLPRWVAEPRVMFADRVALEQASSEHAANYKAELLAARLAARDVVAPRFADLGAGLGVDAVALARALPGLRGVLFEQDASRAEFLVHNLGVFGLADRLTAVCGDGPSELQRTAPALDLVYLDPARRDRAGARVHGFAACTPNPLPLLPTLLQNAPLVAIKASPMLDIDEAVRQLGSVAEVHVVASNGDCKELLFLVTRDAPAEARIVAAEGRAGRPWQTLEFTRQEEAAAVATLSEPLGYVLDPGPAVSKAGAFRTLAARCGLRKLATNTHLYTTNALPTEPFPGRVFRVVDRGGLRARDAKALFPEGRALLLARNAGESVATLRTRLRLRDGGEQLGIAFRDCNGEAVLLRVERVHELPH